MYLPDISGNTYQTSPERHRRFSSSKLFKGPLWFYPRFFFLVFWTGVKALFTADILKMVTLQSRRTMRMAERQGVELYFEGLDNFPSEGAPYVFACNHMGTMDINALPGLVASRIPLSFVVKESLVKIPLFKRVMRKMKAIPVSRKHPGEDLRQVLEKGGELLSQGISVILFPEGTRQDVFLPERFNSLAVKLALRAGVPVIPVALKTDFWGVGKVFREMGPLRPERAVRISFGTPLYPRGRGRTEHQAVLDFIENHLNEWKEL